MDDPLAELEAWWEAADDDGGANTMVSACELLAETRRFDFSTVDDAGARADWRLDVGDCLDFVWRWRVYDRPRWFADHVLLAPYSDRTAWVSFARPLPDPLRVWGALAQAHREMANDFLPLERFFRPTMLKAPFGVLAQGPERFMAVYESALKALGADVAMAFSSLSRDSDKPAPSVVVWGDSYFVARSFRLERTG